MRRLIALLLAASAALLAGTTFDAGAGTRGAKPKVKVVKIVARRFSYSPNQIVLKVGEPAVLEFKSLDFIHGFSIPDLNIRADLPPGKLTRVALKPEKAGSYDFLCDNFCGSGHEGMSGRILVTQ